jgi:CysZ protein
MGMLALPWLVGLVGLSLGLYAFLTHDDRVMDWLLFARPVDSWAMLALYYVCRALLYVGIVVLAMVGSLLVVNVASAPVFEAISVAVEREVTGKEPPSLGLGGNLRLILTEVKKVLFIVVVSVALLLIPGVNVLSAVVSAFLVGWDFYDYPLARRGWTLSERLAFLRDDVWAVLGFGLWLSVPFLQLVLLPLAVAGGTLLNLESLARRGERALRSP